jgi:hypothetical protein
LHVRYELFEMLRKLALTSLLVVLTETATSYLVVAFGVSCVALVLTACFRPYQDAAVDRLQLYSLSVTSITGFYGVLLAAGVDETDPADAPAHAAIVAALTVAIVVLPLLEPLFSEGQAGAALWHLVQIAFRLLRPGRILRKIAADPMPRSAEFTAAAAAVAEDSVELEMPSLAAQSASGRSASMPTTGSLHAAEGRAPSAPDLAAPAGEGADAPTSTHVARPKPESTVGGEMAAAVRAAPPRKAKPLYDSDEQGLN